MIMCGDCRRLSQRVNKLEAKVDAMALRVDALESKADAAEHCPSSESGYHGWVSTSNEAGEMFDFCSYCKVTR